MAFDSFAPTHSACGLPVYVARVPVAPFCETPFKALASDTDALQGDVPCSEGRPISIFFRCHLLRRFENLGSAMLIEPKHNGAGSDHYIVHSALHGFNFHNKRAISLPSYRPS